MKNVYAIFFSLLLYLFPLRAGNIITAVIQHESSADSMFTSKITITCYTDISLEAGNVPIIFYPGIYNLDSLQVTEETEMDGIRKTVYTVYENYHAPGIYTAFFYGNNMIDGISNITGSGNIPIYTEADIYILNPIEYNGNSSPQILNVPIITTQTGESLNFNMAAFDADGDQLRYSFSAPAFPISEFLHFTGIPDGIILDTLTGEISWDNVTENGIFMLPLLITEIREGNTIGTTQVNIMLYSGIYPGHATAIAEQHANTLHIFPSPAADLLNVQFPEETEMLQVINMNGITLKKISIATSERSASIPLDDMAAGIYFIQCTGGYGSKIERFVKN